MIKNYTQYIKESYNEIHSNYVMIDDDETDKIYIGKVKLSNRNNFVDLSYFYWFDKSKLKLEKISGTIRFNDYTLNITYQSDSLKNCLIKISNLYDGIQKFKTYKKYIIGENDKYIGLYEVEYSEPWIKYMNKYPNVKLHFSYYPESERKKIFDHTNSKYENSPKSIMSFNVDMNTIKEFDSFDDAYSVLEIKQDANKFNL